MTVPAEFQGVWKRTALALDGEFVVDTQDVFWLQTESVSGDIRAPLSGGTPSVDPRVAEFQECEVMWGPEVEVDDVAITWQVELESGLGSGTYNYRWQDAVLVEIGTSVANGRQFNWEEHWVRLTRPCAEAYVGHDENHLSITIGGFRLSVDTFPRFGHLSMRTPTGWVQRVRVGDLHSA